MKAGHLRAFRTGQYWWRERCSIMRSADWIESRRNASGDEENDRMVVQDGRPVVVVTRPTLPGRGLDRLAEHVEVIRYTGDAAPTLDQLVPLLARADGLLSMTTDLIDAHLLDAAPRLRVVSNAGVGTDNLDLPELTARGIAAGNTPDVLVETTADLAFALILAASRRVVEADRYVREGRWQDVSFDLLLGHDVHAATLGIVGYGAIGRAVARRGHGFAMTVIHHSRTRRDDELSRWVPLDELLRSADVVSVHTPLTVETRGLIGARELGLMKRSAVLVNTSRGPVVDQAALAAALAQGRIFAAGLDVAAIEPIPLDEPLLRLPNCIVLPHIGSASLATRSAMVDLAVDNILAGLAGDRLPHCANPQVYGAATA
jgi:lactate dehydrogenase-like 2-hydroxyacid dehydrogenase